MLQGTRGENEHDNFRSDEGSPARQNTAGHGTARSNVAVTVLVIDGFSMLTLSAIIEPFNQANQADGSDHFTWQLIGTSRRTALASCGIEIELSDDLTTFRYDIGSSQKHFVVVCAGGDVDRHVSPKTRTFLRGMARRGATLVGAGTGAWMIADADLLSERECTIHWTKMPSFAERFRDVAVNGQRVHTQGNIQTCAGEMASFDFSLEIIRTRLGAVKTNRLAKHLLGNSLPSTNTRQRFPRSLLYEGSRHPLVQAITAMESNIAERKSLREIARMSSVSRRQLERLFMQHMQMTPAQYYNRLRLEWGKSLVEQTCIPIIDVAVASGFVTASHFSRSFRNLFSCLPSELRSTGRGAATTVTAQI